MNQTISELRAYFSNYPNWEHEVRTAKRQLKFGSWDNVYYGISKTGPSEITMTTVDLDALEQGNVIQANCQCFAFLSKGFCPHIWSLFLSLDQNHMLQLQDLHSNKTTLWKRSSSLLSFELVDALLARNEGNNNTWQESLDLISSHPDQHPLSLVGKQRKKNQIWYALDVMHSMASPSLIIRVFHKVLLSDGSWGALKRMTFSSEDLSSFHSDDQYLLQIMEPISLQEEVGIIDQKHAFTIPEPFKENILSRLTDTERFFVLENMDQSGENPPLKWDPDVFNITLSIGELGTSLTVRSILKSDHSILIWKQLHFIHSSGYLLHKNHLSPVGNIEALPWIQLFNSDTPIIISDTERTYFLNHLSKIKNLPFLEFAPELNVREEKINPIPVLQVMKSTRKGTESTFKVAVRFHYNKGMEIDPRDGRSSFFDFIDQTWFKRMFKSEIARIQELPSEWFKFQLEDENYSYRISEKHVFSAIRSLITKGWRVEVEGLQVKRAEVGNIHVSSGIDWFDLNVDIKFDRESVELSDLLTQIRKNDGFITLADGSKGILDETWTKSLQKFLEFTDPNEDLLRFKPSQTLILDALLSALPHVDLDEKFMTSRDRLKHFKQVHSIEAPAGFRGELRDYQKVGLGWFHFLQDINVNGCLADDMGLGKTIQVLALLQERKLESQGTSVVVVPKSLVQNWINEAEQFTPDLRVLAYEGTNRKKQRQTFSDYDLVIMTYGILRRDITFIRDISWDYAILDESQAIKNARAQATKATRLLQSKHRLALTGTPIENHIGELWSQFEYLNPGMLGHSSLFKVLSSKKEPLSVEERDTISKGLKPFILRRTKTQVLKELPLKTEQTLFCNMEQTQRTYYNQLKQTLQKSIAEKVDASGLKKSKIDVLTALLRLRQAACHPALLQAGATESIKFQVLLQHLEEIIDEGHKALIFSQFTSLLGLLKKEIFERGWAFEYLDGKSRRREESIQRFQEEEHVRVFLISLKAGGLGLNLTAADYVYILDPWWNPAVENQAIDRAHRIGQTKSVIAYRLIVKDSVEEKILALQKRKTNLAEALITEDNRILSDLTPEDLDLLLS